jgi:hypothetical protein
VTSCALYILPAFSRRNGGAFLVQFGRHEDGFFCTSSTNHFSQPCFSYCVLSPLQYVLWRVLVALNNTIARAKFHHVKYIVDQGLVALLLPLCHSTSVRVRLQALWIVGNTGTSEGDNGFKNVILSVDLVETILEVMYLLPGCVCYPLTCVPLRVW